MRSAWHGWPLVGFGMLMRNFLPMRVEVAPVSAKVRIVYMYTCVSVWRRVTRTSLGAFTLSRFRTPQR